MRFRSLAVAALVALAPGVARAGCDFDAADKWLLVGASASLAVDWAQTTQFLADKRGRYEETNPILGTHPSAEHLAVYNLTALAATFGVACLLPSTPRKLLLGGFIAVEVYAVSGNYQLTGSWGF